MTRFALANSCQEVWVIMFLFEILAKESLVQRGVDLNTIFIVNVASLSHEVEEDLMESGSFVRQPILTWAKLSKAFGSPWSNIIIELKEESSLGHSIDFKVKVANGTVSHFKLSFLLCLRINCKNYSEYDDIIIIFILPHSISKYFKKAIM